MLKVSSLKSKGYLAHVDGQEIARSANILRLAEAVFLEAPEEVEHYAINDGEAEIDLHPDDEVDFKEQLKILHFKENGAMFFQDDE